MLIEKSQSRAAFVPLELLDPLSLPDFEPLPSPDFLEPLALPALESLPLPDFLEPLELPALESLPLPDFLDPLELPDLDPLDESFLLELSPFKSRRVSHPTDPLADFPPLDDEDPEPELLDIFPPLDEPAAFEDEDPEPEPLDIFPPLEEPASFADFDAAPDALLVKEWPTPRARPVNFSFDSFSDTSM